MGPQEYHRIERNAVPMMAKQAIEILTANGLSKHVIAVEYLVTALELHTALKMYNPKILHGRNGIAEIYKCSARCVIIFNSTGNN